MTLASDLAAIVCAATIVQPGYVHDPAHPLVVGDSDGGEFGVFSFNPVNRTVEIKAASDIVGAVSTLSLSADGAFSVNGVGFPTLGQLDAAVAAAQAAATAASSSASSAASSAAAAASTLSQIQALIGDSGSGFTEALIQMEILVDKSETAAADAQAAAASVAGVVDTVGTVAGQASGSADAAATHAATAQAAASSAQSVAGESRYALTRDVIGDETFQAGHLFKRGLVAISGSKTITIPPNMHTSADPREAWASFRLESGTALNFAGGGGGGSPTPPSLGAGAGTAPLGGRRNPTEPSSVFPGLLSGAPAVAAGKLVLMASASFNAAGVAGDASIALGAGLVATRLLNFSNPTVQYTPDFAFWEAPLTSFPGGDISISLSASPNISFVMMTAFILTSVGAAAPVMARNVPTGNAASRDVTLTAVPDGARILAMAVQRGGEGSGAGFSSWSPNVTGLSTYNTYGVPDVTVANTAAFRNGNGSSASGVQSGAGSPTITCNFNPAATQIGAAAIAYPSAGGTTAAVTIVAQGGRTALNIVGGEAVLWFKPDGRTVHLHCPAS